MQFSCPLGQYTSSDVSQHAQLFLLVTVVCNWKCLIVCFSSAFLTPSDAYWPSCQEWTNSLRRRSHLPSKQTIFLPDQDVTSRLWIVLVTVLLTVGFEKYFPYQLEFLLPGCHKLHLRSVIDQDVTDWLWGVSLTKMSPIGFWRVSHTKVSPIEAWKGCSHLISLKKTIWMDLSKGFFH